MLVLHSEICPLLICKFSDMIYACCKKKENSQDFFNAKLGALNILPSCRPLGDMFGLTP
jgi:hypothetical protein